MQDYVYLIYYRYEDNPLDRRLPGGNWLWVNWAVSEFTKSDLIHVEMEFSDRICYGIAQGTSIMKIEGKPYSRSKYQCQKITGSTAQIQAMRTFLEDRMSEPSGFNYWGFYMMPCFPSSGMQKNKWFCSELMGETLLAGGFNLPVKPYHLSPGMLWKAVKDSGIGYIDAMVNSSSKDFVL